MSSAPSTEEIARSALEFWDMNAEEAESEHALKVAVARDLVELGVPKETAALAAALADRAFNALEFPDRPVDEVVKAQPLYQAMVAELSAGGYQRIGDFE